MLLAVAQQRWSSWEGLRSAELLLSFGLQVGLSLLLFGGWLPERIAEHLLYLPMVLLIWLCVRFSLAEVAAGTVVFSVAAVWGTSRGLGAYRTEALQSLFDLQILLNTYAVTGLVLSSITIGRRASETAARRAADELRKERAERSRAETWFQQLLAASPDALVVANDQGRIVLANEAAERLLGYARDELTGQPVELLVPLSLRERHQAHRDRYHASPHVRLMGTGVELVARRKDGTEFPAEIALGPMQSAEGLFVFSAIRDITARKRAQEIIVRREAQLVAAEQIQQRLLPQHTPHVPGLDIAGRCYPAESAAGDYFDYLRLPDESFLAVTGDVAGHGIGPAILMAWLHAYIRLLSETYTDLAELVTRANVALLERTGADRFVTLIAGRFDPRSGTLTYLNAGHPSGYVVDRAGRVKHVLESTGLPLAIDVDTRFVLGPTVELGDGDTVVFLTDGVLEAAPTTRRQFGTEACLGVVRASLDQGAAEIVERLYVAACQHAGRERLEDDVTIVVVKVSADFRRSETAGPDTRRLDTTPPLRDNAVVTGVGPGEHDMAMQSSDEDVLVVALSAEPELNEELKDTVSVVLNRSRCDVVMNLANVGLVTSSSLSALLRLKKLQKDRGRRLVLCHVSRTTRKIFEATGIEGLFEFAADQEEALASVQAGRNKLGLFPAGDESLPS
jgi:anti-anti-sigma factor